VHNDVATHLCVRFVDGMRGWDHQRLHQALLRRFADAVAARGAPLPNCVGFIDGTVRAICRPARNQRASYNGHHRVHALKYQSVVTPDGIIAHLAGPFVGRRHDALMLGESALLPRLAAHLNGVHGPFYFYGDPAYGLSPHLQSPCKGALATEEQAKFNTSMSAVRQAVEWLFGKVVSLWAFVDFKKIKSLAYNKLARFTSLPCCSRTVTLACTVVRRRTHSSSSRPQSKPI
jgi:nuclease HARBI1